MKNIHFTKLERMYENHPLNKFFKARIDVNEKKSLVTLPISEKLFHAANAVHGSVYFKALDDAAFFAANSIVGDVFLLTTSFNIYLTRPISSGEMRAVGTLVNFNNTQLIAEAVLYDSDNREIARGSGVYVKSRLKLTNAMGYD